MSERTSLKSLFEPTSIAVIGASASPDKAGFAMMQSLTHFTGRLYPVNPRGGEVLGHRAYASIAQIGEPVDLAVLVIPPSGVPQALQDCANAGVASAVVCSGGFGESGAEGLALQNEVAGILAETGLRLLGPNTSGFMNPGTGASANFMPAVVDLSPGAVSVIAQSGGVNLALSFLLDEAGVGLRLGVGLGNAVDVGFADVIDHLADDDHTKAIGLHVEGVADGRALVAAVERASRRKPVVAFKVGRNDVGEFAQSHTGALTGSYALTRQALRQAGAVVVDSPSRLVDALAALSHVRLDPVAEPGVGIITGQAGPGLIIADALASTGVLVPSLTDDTTATLNTLLPPLTYQKNPVDTGRPGPSFPEVLNAVGADPAVELVGIYALDEPGTLDPAQASAASPVPTLYGTGGPRSVIDARRAELGEHGIPMFDSPERLANAIDAVVQDARGQAARAAAEADVTERIAVPQLPTSAGGNVDENDAKQLLNDLGLPVLQRAVARDHDEAADALLALGGPVVVKVLDPAILHKSDVGGVHLGVTTLPGLRSALETIDAIPGDKTDRRYLLEQQAGDGSELIVGALRDPVFGPVVLLALGGVGVELGTEPILRLAPIGRTAALSAIAELPTAILTGFRGAPPVDRDGLADILVRVSQLIAAHPRLLEVDLNPVRATADGLKVLDALFVTTPEV